ncbi:hypothetical protein WJX74_005956 [Apatococcus lobatus]|uniref:Uncharacterized protein n=1 Tax=Apatococcus lobatus TaxID=904363 RepID=A0AAW1QJQ3_9CHLO
MLGYRASIEGSAFCKWLEPRAAGLESFSFPVDAVMLRNKTCLIQQLLMALPASLTQLRLQGLRPDLTYLMAAKDTSHLDSLPHLHHKFQVLQDTAPHLASLTRLSKLQKLSLPLHAPLDSLNLNSLGALKSLQNLHLEWRDQRTDWQGNIGI